MSTAATAAAASSVLREVDDATWDGLVDRLAGSIYFSSRWLRLVERVFRVRAVLLALFDEDGAPAAVLPLLLRRRGPFLLAGSPLHDVATPSLGVLAASAAGLQQALVALDTYQAAHGVDYCELIFSQSVNLELLQAHGYRVLPALTLHLRLGGETEETVWRRFDKVCRTSVRKARKEGVTVRDAKDRGFISRYLELAREVYGRQGLSPPLPATFFEAVWDAYAPSGDIRVLLAEVGDELVAAGIFLADGHTICFEDGVSSALGNRVCANNMIQMEAIRWGLARGAEIYDMVGAGHPGIRRFKASFGAELVETTRGIRTNSPGARLALAAFLWARPLARRVRNLPSFVAGRARRYGGR